MKFITENGGDALIGDDLKQAALARVFGFEILPAPFVVAHLQLGLLLQNLGSPLSDDSNERVGVYLTNALTGWEPPKEPKARLLFPEMKLERDAADRVKRETPILVILGNPPYNGFAGLAVAEERDLTTAYRTTNRVAAPQGQGLNDLYVRFYRMAERRIVERSGEGIVCFISNYSWLDGRSFTGMRERYLEAFDSIVIDCLNGDKYKTGKLTPDGLPDPSIFSTEWNREGIQIGTAIALLVRKVTRTHDGHVRFRHLWGKEKRSELLSQAADDSLIAYADHTPVLALGLPFAPMATDSPYGGWPLLNELLPTSYPGVQTKQDALLIDISQEDLTKRMETFFDAAISDAELERLYPGSMDGTNACDPKPTRRYLAGRGLLRSNIVPFAYRAFDRRWIYWEPETNLLGRKSPDFFPQVFAGNHFFEARQKESGSAYGRGMVVSILADNFGNGFSNFFPKLIRRQPDELDFTGNARELTANLSPKAEAYLRSLKLDSDNLEHATLLFFHVIASVHSSAYRTENADALRLDWPRIPLPACKQTLVQSAGLGQCQ
jgi:predicted helicase